MAKILNFNQKNIAREIFENKQEYCQALEKVGIPFACQENLSGLLELLDPFFEELTSQYSTSEIQSNGQGNLGIPPSKFSSNQIYGGLTQMKLIHEGCLTQRGYDIITFYRERKNLPTREEETEEALKRIFEHSKQLDW